MKKIAFAGTDGRTLLCAWVVATATSENHTEEYQGVVVRGTPAMPKWVEAMNWPVTFVPTDSNSVEDYARGIIGAMERGERVTIAGFGSFRVVERAEQKGRNPQTGEPLTIPAHNVVKFRPGKNLCKRVKI